jgi:hypothetical protein
MESPLKNPIWLCGAALFLAPTGLYAQGTKEDHSEIHHSPEATRRFKGEEAEIVKFFQYPFLDSQVMDQDAQASTYDKQPVSTQRPLLELGRALYQTGPASPGLNLWGEKNLFFPHLMVYGDWRFAAGYSNGGDGSPETSRIATRLNLDIDIGLTATERIHALVRPLEKDGNFTRIGLGGADSNDSDVELDFEPETLFFEGDLGAMFGGPGSHSIPIALGKIPLLFQNGVWVEDAFTGVAVTMPAKNSRALDIANYDVTIFAGFEDVTTDAANKRESDVQMYGITSFIEANNGYWEVGYAYVAGSGVNKDIDYHNVTASFARRYGQWLSNTVRVIGNFGQKQSKDTADGVLLLVENSFITRKPSTLIPYLNLFAGFGSPQSLARAAGAGGVLKNTGLNFEEDALTDFPSLDATGHDAIGAAAGVEYLFELDRQIVLEIAGQHYRGNDFGKRGDDIALGLRYQQPFELFGTRRALWRVDGIIGNQEEEGQISGIRFELRWKF